MKIDWKLFPMKLHYFVRFSGTGPLTPFLPVIVRNKGVSAQVVGLIWTVMPFVSLVSKTCAGALSDYFRIHRAVFLSGLMLMMVSFTGIYFSPDITTNSINNSTRAAKELLINTKNSTQAAEELFANTTGHLTHHSNNNSDFHISELPVGDLMRRYEFWILFLCLLGQYCGHITTITMQETICFSLLGDALHKYGEQRLWGTLGWGLAAVIGGALVDWYSKGLTQVDYAPVHLMAVAFLAMDLLIVALLKFSITTHKMNPAAVRGVLKLPPALLILITTVMAGASCGMVWTFQFILVEDVANAWQADFPYMKLLQGLLIFVQCILSEMPFFFMAGYIIAKIGHFITFFIALLAFCVRLCLYATVTNPWWFLPIELIHGLSFGLAYASMASYANSITPKGAEATTQAIFGAAFFGGTGVGGLVGGWLFSIMNDWNAFLTMGIINGIYAVIFLVVHLLISRLSPTEHIQGKKTEKPPEAATEEEMEKFQGDGESSP